MRLMTLPHITSGVVSLPICGARDVAQDFDGRSDTLNQKQMKKCAFADFERADRRLNAVYAKVRAAKRERDGELESQWRGTEKSLVEGQRGWVAYRDGHCVVAGSHARGGSMEPLLVWGCKAALTGARTTELSELIE
jgi:uncharacterized protein YecT (DUF1311 family)